MPKLLNVLLLFLILTIYT